MPELHLYSSLFRSDWGELLPHSIRTVGDASSDNRIESLYTSLLDDQGADYIGIHVSNWLLDLRSIGLSSETSNALVLREAGVDLFSLETLCYAGASCEALEGVALDAIFPLAYDESSISASIGDLLCNLSSGRIAAVVFDWLKTYLAHANSEYARALAACGSHSRYAPEGCCVMRASLAKEFAGWALPIARECASSLCNQGDSHDAEKTFCVAMHYLLMAFTTYTSKARGLSVAYASSVYVSHYESPYLLPANDESIVVAIPTDSPYAALASITVASVLDNSLPDRTYEFVIVDAGMSETDRVWLEHQVEQSDRAVLRFLSLPSGRLRRDAASSNRLGFLAFARLSLLGYLNAFRRFICLAPGSVCMGPLSDLNDMNLGEGCIAVVDRAADSAVEGGNNTPSTSNCCLDTMLVDVTSATARDGWADMLGMALSPGLEKADAEIIMQVLGDGASSLNYSWCVSAKGALPDDSRIVRFDKQSLPFCEKSRPCNSWLFWKYARRTPYYETLVGLMPSGRTENLGKTSARYSSDLGPLVSVIMPVYNSAEFIGATLDSLLAQTYSNLELICVNDGSKDNSLDVLRAYERFDSRVVVVDKENSGAGATRNIGMEHIHGKYACFVDSDDFLEPDAFELLVAAAEDNLTDVVVFGIDWFDNITHEYIPNEGAIVRGRVPLGRVFYAANIDNFYKYLVGFTVNKLYLSSFLLGLNLRFPKIGAHEDMPFTYLALSASKRTFVLDETLYHYRRAREGSLSDSTSKNYMYMFNALDCLKKELCDRGLWEDYERLYVNYALHLCVWKSGDLGRFRAIEFRDACHTTWFDYYGISGKESSYFFDEDDWHFYENVSRNRLSRSVVAALYRVYRKIR